MRIILYIILALGIIARILGLFNDLWLDEIWALDLIKNISSWQEIFTTIHRDNNHIINSLWNYILGQNANGYAYRLPSFLFSIATLFVANKINSNKSEADRKLSILTLALFSLSYVMVLYGTEARGYAGLVFFSLTTFYLSERLLQDFSIKLLISFWLSAILGLFSHLSWIGFYVALFIWMSIEAFQKFGLTQAIKKITLWHLPLSAIVMFEYLIDAKYILQGSGDMRSRFDVLVDTLSVFAGGPLTSPSNLGVSLCSLIFAVVVLGLLLSEIYQLWKLRDNKFYFYITLIIILPFLVIESAPRVLFVRYFLVNIAFAYLLFARGICRIDYYNLKGRYLASILLLIVLTGNLFYLSSFVRHGRGEYADILSYMQQKDVNPEIIVSGEQDFRNEMLIDYYNNKLNDIKPIRYVTSKEVGSNCPNWYLQQTSDTQLSAVQSFKHSCGSNFKLEKEAPFTALSGWRWMLYRNKNQ